MRLCAALLLALTAPSVAHAADTAARREWIDPDTGHRIVRLSDEPGSASLYFNYNGYTPQGDKLLISTPKGIASVDLKTRALKTVVPITGPFRLLFTGHRTRTAYYQTQAADGQGAKTIWAADIDSGKVRKVAAIDHGDIQTINADETLLGGVETDPNASSDTLALFAKKDARYDQADYRATGPDGKPLTYAEAKEVRMNERLEARVPMAMFVIDTRTGQKRIVHRATDWLNHLQFSPTDPGLLMFCHEGPWHKVDRLWLMRIDRSNDMPRKIHTRTMNMEIAGHEWFSHDGRTVWYDLQTPRGEDFWVAGYDVATGKRTQYHLNRNEWSVHFNSSPDGKLFSGDGGDREMVAHSSDGKWLYLFRPRPIPDVAGIRAPDADALIQPGVFKAEKLVNMQRQDYRLEPNANFTPDGKWLVFRSNMQGGQQVYAVEIAKARP
ncbi:oligogalacturonate lyase family protein [Sphingomonas sanguinis]|jgi:oligogalacturonide lyase|uniref:Oligogalacturonate lyase n=1 Tax=Sphingomonas sanguinis TaxID=33051 RepID=A0A7Y7QVL0_9SPHN|nr:oligogalacturonate lyase family protein [Sphingomonas sanguinis]MBZ6382183.1 oligogalacturonate lyase family protein [Sphingomonas sanguinis]NNG50769.1 oligogalacturonate lyase [Sphingomonas sanguinis]NNG54443.1 oligogalacturonate lyase [Sphingomonas sanguinis]NVP31481.1 PD40 domain-containing protein [Sphingomonas sanguinis]